MKNICVYGASSDKIDKKYLDSAYELGRLIAQGGYGLVFGAGNIGVMGAAARGAHSADGKVIGVIPTFMTEIPGVEYQECDEIVETETMRERKRMLEELSDAFIAAPGGIGTLEEFFEILTLKQLLRHGKALVLLNIDDYYHNLIAMLDTCILEGFTSSNMRMLFEVAQTPQQAMHYIEHYSYTALPDKWHDTVGV